MLGVLPWRTVNPPVGTFLAKVREGLIQVPPPLKYFCRASGWTLFAVSMRDDSSLELRPILPGEDDADPIITETLQVDAPCSSLSNDGTLWIPASIRGPLRLGEQSVMMRIEGDVMAMYLRNVFETLGFGP
jgi:hypothetical protein